MLVPRQGSPWCATRVSALVFASATCSARQRSLAPGSVWVGTVTATGRGPPAYGRVAPRCPKGMPIILIDDPHHFA